MFQSIFNEDNSEVTAEDISKAGFSSSGCADNIALNDVGIIIGANSSLQSASDEYIPSLSRCFATAYKDKVGAEKGSVSLEVTEFCSKFHNLVSSFKFLSIPKPISLGSELSSMVSLFCY